MRESRLFFRGNSSWIPAKWKRAFSFTKGFEMTRDALWFGWLLSAINSLWATTESHVTFYCELSAIKDPTPPLPSASLPPLIGNIRGRQVCGNARSIFCATKEDLIHCIAMLRIAVYCKSHCIALRLCCSVLCCTDILLYRARILPVRQHSKYSSERYVDNGLAMGDRNAGRDSVYHHVQKQSWNRAGETTRRLHSI